MAAAPMGTLMKKMARQETLCTSQPPRRGPAAVVTPDSPAQAPMAAPWSSSAMAVRSTARLPGRRTAAAPPWEARATVKASVLDTRPQTAEAAANQATPRTKIRRWPKTSPRVPPRRRKALRVRRKASTVHWRPAMLAPSSRCSAGSATVRAVPSRKAIPEPSTEASTTPRPWDVPSLAPVMSRPAQSAATRAGRRNDRRARSLPGRQAPEAPPAPRLPARGQCCPGECR